MPFGSTDFYFWSLLQISVNSLNGGVLRSLDAIFIDMRTTSLAKIRLFPSETGSNTSFILWGKWQAASAHWQRSPAWMVSGLWTWAELCSTDISRPPLVWQHHLGGEGHMGRGWASVLKTYLSNWRSSASSEKSRYKYFSVSPRKKLSILSLGPGLAGSSTLLIDV